MPPSSRPNGVERVAQEGDTGTGCPVGHAWGALSSRRSLAFKSRARPREETGGRFPPARDADAVVVGQVGLLRRERADSRN